MKKLLRLLLVLSMGVVSIACVAATTEVPNRSPEEIEKLASPIALYPDSLVAIILPASTESADVVLAARFLSYGGKEADIDKQFWHDTVKSLAHYPDLIKWMDENLDWTQQMGEAFAAQPADVMAAIQRLRAHARANGLLVDTPQQRVVVEQEVVYIVPASPGRIYIPRYDPDILWMRSSFRGSFINFSVGFGVGNWLFYDCDWPGRTIWVHRRHPGWVYTPYWRPPPPSVRVNVVTAWRPSPHHYNRTHRHGHRPPAVVVVPRPYGGHEHRFHSPGTSHEGFRDGPRDRDHAGRSRPTPPTQNFHGRSPVSVVSPVAPVTPMTHVGVAPSHRPPPTVSHQRPHQNNPQHFTPPPAPPSHGPHAPPQRIHSGPSRPGPGSGSATATLHRSAPRAPSEPSVNAPPPGPPPSQPSPTSGPSRVSRPANHGPSPKPSAPPPPQAQGSSDNNNNSNNSNGGPNGGGRHSRHGR